ANAEVRYRGCPACGVLMNRRNFGRRSGVIVDVCKEHGVWFDADELTAVLEFVARGGLVKQRQSQLEEAQRRLSQRRMDALMQQHRQMPAPRERPTVESAAALIGSIMENLRLSHARSTPRRQASALRRGAPPGWPRAPAPL